MGKMNQYQITTKQKQVWIMHTVLWIASQVILQYNLGLFSIYSWTRSQPMRKYIRLVWLQFLLAHWSILLSCAKNIFMKLSYKIVLPHVGTAWYSLLNMHYVGTVPILKQTWHSLKWESPSCRCPIPWWTKFEIWMIFLFAVRKTHLKMPSPFRNRWPSDAIYHKWTGSSLVLLMACCLLKTKPLPEPRLADCQLDL